jgi:hypothetical protein
VQRREGETVDRPVHDPSPRRPPTIVVGWPETVKRRAARL